MPAVADWAMQKPPESPVRALALAVIAQAFTDIFDAPLAMPDPARYPRQTPHGLLTYADALERQIKARAAFDRQVVMHEAFLLSETGPHAKALETWCAVAEVDVGMVRKKARELKAQAEQAPGYRWRYDRSTKEAA